MNKNIVFAIATVWLFTSGCAIHRSETTRANSFKPYTGKQVNQVDVQSFLSARVVLLFAGDGLPSISTNHVILTTGKGYHGVAGCAAAIDHRGYYITAAHLVKKNTVYLVFKSDAIKDVERARDLGCVEKARVVWCGDPSKKGPDLAILHVPRVIDDVFEWRTNGYVHEGDAVMAVGLSQSKTNYLGLECLGGSIVGTQLRKPTGWDIIHNVPVQNGDSGGPLVAPDGRLIGVNYEGDITVYKILIIPFYWKFWAMAAYPSVKQLEEIIEKDAAASPGEPAAKGSQPQVKSK